MENKKLKIDKIFLINPKPLAENPIIAPLEELERKSRQLLFEKIIERFDLPYDVMKIPSHPSGPSFKIHEGLLSLGAVLIENGYSVKYLQQDYEEFKSQWNLQFKEVCNASVVGVTSYTPTFPDVARLVMKIKHENPEALIILGGPHTQARDIEAAMLSSGIIIVRGEGEKTLLEVLDAVETNIEKLKSIKGITYNIGNVIKRNNDGEPPDINSLPPPAYQLVPEELRRLTEVVIETSRGCSYGRCLFCVESRFFRNLRFKTPEKVVENLHYFQKYFQHKYLFITDSNFPQHPRHIEMLVPAVIKEKLDLVFGCQVRPNYLNSEVIQKLKKLNIVEIYAGVEHGSNAILERMCKGETWNDYNLFFKKVYSRFPFIFASFQVGFPGETYKTHMESLRRLNWLHEKNYVTCIYPRCFIPYPGTPIFEKPQHYDVEITTYNWRNYNRKPFPAVHRLKNLSEYEISTMFLQLYAAEVKCLAKKCGIRFDFRKDFKN